MPAPQTLGELEFEVLKNTLATSTGFMDIGANVGIFSLLAVQNLGFQGPVYAIEPYPENFKMVHRSVDHYCRA